jgi:GxxExxY protein
MTEPLQHSHVTQIILAGFYDVFNVLGSGFVEDVYVAALVIVLRAKGLTVEEEPSLPVYFNDRILGRFTPDLLVNGVVIVEVKAVRAIAGVHKAQVINYLKASNIEVGLLLNFGDTPQFQRFKFDNARKAARRPPEELGEVGQDSESHAADVPVGAVDRDPRR